MKFHILILLGVIIFAPDLLCASNDSETSSYARELDSSDASVRAKAIENLGRFANNKIAWWKHPTEAGFRKIVDDVFPLIARGFRDKSEEVQEASLQALGEIETLKGAWDNANNQDPAYTIFKGDILRAVSNPNPQIRAAAYQIYGGCFGVSPETQALWIRAFSTEQDVDVRKSILKAMARDKSCSPDTLKFIIGELNDPQYTYDVGMTIVGHIKPPPMEALAILVRRFASSNDLGERDLLAQAIAIYGDRARQYLPVVQKMYSKETDPTAKQNLQTAIDSIENNRAGKGGATPAQ